MRSARLEYAPLAPAHLDDFHTLVQDQHIRRYLLDGAVHPPEWSAERIADSEGLFRRRGVGLWLARETGSGALVGFCGFLEVPEPQLIYAVVAPLCGRGYATEMAAACIAEARAHGFGDIHADVDEVNTASVHVLEKLGFQRISVGSGAFGPLVLLRLPAVG